ncbi:MAG: hypothetical protein GY795_03685 [Desulfobacterales bacterium]|nr:hypothetical protein [Desulfobacterales bacterium]
MQIDMHYYGTYTMARAAGLNKEASTIIATASQFVDDNAHKDSVEFDDGSRIDAEATAHHSVDIHNVMPDDQRRIWVPFHFLPGMKGSVYLERLACQKNSPIAQDMIKHSLWHSDAVFFLELMGVAAHVYADTFSHFGFSGVSSTYNAIINDSIELMELETHVKEHLDKKTKSFSKKFNPFDDIASWFAEKATGALGHGAVLTYPDRPYLKWSYVYEHTKEKVVRNNQDTFLEYCEEIYKIFKEVADLKPEYKEESVEFSDIRDTVKEILSVQAVKEDRIAKWRKNVIDGKLFESGGDDIPRYDGWNDDFDRLDDMSNSEVALKSNVFRFFQAAAMHRTFVLRKLLPTHGLVVA